MIVTLIMTSSSSPISDVSIMGCEPAHQPGIPLLAIHVHERARQGARELANRPVFASARRQRKKVEALLAERKNQIGLRRLRLRRMKFVREQFFRAAAAQNIKRLIQFLSQAPQSTLPATT